MSKLLVPLLALAMTSGCRTMPQQIYKPERVKPTEAMAPCVVPVCSLPPAWVTMSLEDQAPFLLNCKIVDVEYSRICSKNHARLVEWINED